MGAAIRTFIFLFLLIYNLNYFFCPKVLKLCENHAKLYRYYARIVLKVETNLENSSEQTYMKYFNGNVQL